MLKKLNQKKNKMFVSLSLALSIITPHYVQQGRGLKSRAFTPCCSRQWRNIISVIKHRFAPALVSRYHIVLTVKRMKNYLALHVNRGLLLLHLRAQFVWHRAVTSRLAKPVVGGSQAVFIIAAIILLLALLFTEFSILMFIHNHSK